ncbi:MAG TPA: cytochrome o ubiquinol oxidase subunit IV [Steroidobacteraceae bacterium]|nr:cytochrome o ubiquinol oxidase subunit IV [Steroidobacteraceae bacterium]
MSSVAGPPPHEGHSDPTSPLHPHTQDAGSVVGGDRLPGEPSEAAPGALAPEIRGYLIGLLLAIGLTVAAFWALHTHLIYGPGIMMAVVVLALAQMGIHLVFFLHLTTAPDNINNALALAFGVLMAGLIVFGSVWVMNHLNHNMLPMQQLLQMQP